MGYGKGLKVLLIGLVFMGPLCLNLCVKGPKKPQQIWLPPVNPRERSDIPTREYVKPTQGLHDWEEDKRLETHEWTEFLEEIENRGLDPWDPEAIEIWDSNYN